MVCKHTLPLQKLLKINCHNAKDLFFELTDEIKKTCRCQDGIKFHRGGKLASYHLELANQSNLEILRKECHSCNAFKRVEIYVIRASNGRFVIRVCRDAPGAIVLFTLMMVFLAILLGLVIWLAVKPKRN